MQASGGQQQEDGQGHVGSPQDGRSGSIGVGGESMSRNGSASAIAAVTAASPTSSQSHSDGGAATPAGHRLKIRIGGSTLGGSNHRTGSVSSEGTNGHSTPRATTPVAVPAAVSTPKSNGHLEHHDGAKTMHNGDISRETIKQELDNEGRAVSVSSEKLSQAASQQERLDPKPPSKTEEKQDELPVQEAQEDEETKRKKEEQLRSALAELPNVARQSLVPLYELVRRLVARSYTDLQNIVEV